MTNDAVPNLYISGRYRKMLKNRTADKNDTHDDKTREFLANNVRNARWLLESIEQRRGTILAGDQTSGGCAKGFFDKGPEYLKPLPMIEVADRLGIHVATVSRAVSEKWIQTPRGVFPLRRFFSGGTTSAEGQDMSWDAVKEKLRRSSTTKISKIQSTTMTSSRSSRNRASISPAAPWPNIEKS